MLPSSKPSLPLGFAFRPTDEELVFYLERKVSGQPLPTNAISEIDNIYRYEPWDLPVMSLMNTGGREWYFFILPNRKYSTGLRANRSTTCGYWKSTGKDRLISLTGETRATKKTLVYYRGRVPKGDRTDWVIFEYRLTTIKDSFVLWKLFQKGNNGSHGLISENAGGLHRERSALPEFPENMFPSLQDSFILCKLFHKGNNGSQSKGLISENAGGLHQETFVLPEFFLPENVSDISMLELLGEDTGKPVTDLSTSNEKGEASTLENILSTVRENEREGRGGSGSEEVVDMDEDEDEGEYSGAQKQQQLSQQPRLLTWECCIFRRPYALSEMDLLAFAADFLSIGPHQHRIVEDPLADEAKRVYTKSLLQRKGLTLEYILEATKPLEARVRESYSEAIDQNGMEFIEMLVFDGCFIIELLLRVTGLVEQSHAYWNIGVIMRDLLVLENLLPFFLLDHLYNLTKPPPKENEEETPSLAMLALNFFNHELRRPVQVIEQYSNIKPKHLLDLLRSSFITHDLDKPRDREESALAQFIPCVSKLRAAGIKFKPGKADTILDIRFSDGVLEIPPLRFDHLIVTFVSSCIAYEQCDERCSDHFTAYATFMRCLIASEEDAEYLHHDGIILIGPGWDNNKVAHFFNQVGKDVVFDIENCFLSTEFVRVCKYEMKSRAISRCSLFSSPSLLSWAALPILFLLWRKFDGSYV